MKNFIAILILFGLTSIAYANDNYAVETKIYDGGNLIGSPAMRVEPNKEVGAAVSGSYDLRLSIALVDENTASVTTKLVIGGEHLSPSMHVELGKESTVTVGGKSLSVVVSKVSS